MKINEKLISSLFFISIFICFSACGNGDTKQNSSIESIAATSAYSENESSVFSSSVIFETQQITDIGCSITYKILEGFTNKKDDSNFPSGEISIFMQTQPLDSNSWCNAFIMFYYMKSGVLSNYTEERLAEQKQERKDQDYETSDFNYKDYDYSEIEYVQKLNYQYSYFTEQDTKNSNYKNIFAFVEFDGKIFELVVTPEMKKDSTWVDPCSYVIEFLDSLVFETIRK